MTPFGSRSPSSVRNPTTGSASIQPSAKNSWLFTLQSSNSVIMLKHYLFIFWTTNLFRAIQKKTTREIPREERWLDFISIYTTDIRYIHGSCNIVAYAFSRHLDNTDETTTKPEVSVESLYLEDDRDDPPSRQADETELQQLLSGDSSWSSALVLSCLDVENHVKIFFVVLCNRVLSHLKVKNLFKIYFIVLCNQVLSLLKVENHVKIYFIVLCNQVLSPLKVENPWRTIYFTAIDVTLRS